MYVLQYTSGTLLRLYIFIYKPYVVPYLSIHTACLSVEHPIPLMYQDQEVHYLACKFQDFHLASLVVRPQAPEEFIFRWSAVGDPLVFQIPWRKENEICF